MGEAKPSRSGSASASVPAASGPAASAPRRATAKAPRLPRRPRSRARRRRRGRARGGPRLRRAAGPSRRRRRGPRPSRSGRRPRTSTAGRLTRSDGRGRVVPRAATCAAAAAAAKEKPISPCASNTRSRRSHAQPSPWAEVKHEARKGDAEVLREAGDRGVLRGVSDGDAGAAALADGDVDDPVGDHRLRAALRTWEGWDTLLPMTPCAGVDGHVFFSSPAAKSRHSSSDRTVREFYRYQVTVEESANANVL